MKKILFLVALAMSAEAMARDVYVKPHVRSDGTYVQGHYRTSPNRTTNDNWSTSPNVNPHTGQQGTRQPDPYGSSGSRTRSTRPYCGLYC